MQNDQPSSGAAVPYQVRLYRIGLSRQLRAEVVIEGRVVAAATIAGEGPLDEAVALARQWAADRGYPTPAPKPRSSPIDRWRE
ncbi:MAG: hypothetical protein M1298_00475 [Chloroflexi bacterium]|nr:hypothetical protein [Chloroflexota bacterium]